MDRGDCQATVMESQRAGHDLGMKEQQLQVERQVFKFLKNTPLDQHWFLGQPCKWAKNTLEAKFKQMGTLKKILKNTYSFVQVHIISFQISLPVPKVIQLL